MTIPALGTDVVVQVAIVVRDIEVKARAWAETFGLPMPEIMITDPAEQSQIRYQGEPTEARARLAFFRLGQVSLELIEPIGGPSTWMDHLETHGEGLHHIAFEIKGMNERIGYLEGQGLPLVQRGQYTGGRYAYVDGMPLLGTVIELLEND